MPDPEGIKSAQKYSIDAGIFQPKTTHHIYWEEKLVKGTGPNQKGTHIAISAGFLNFL